MALASLAFSVNNSIRLSFGTLEHQDYVVACPEFGGAAFLVQCSSCRTAGRAHHFSAIVSWYTRPGKFYQEESLHQTLPL
eukprot:scaffold2949_cov92-Skeletonema_dohrnii-CCMP3373.AAC.7